MNQESRVPAIDRVVCLLYELTTLRGFDVECRTPEPIIRVSFSCARYKDILLDYGVPGRDIRAVLRAALVDRGCPLNEPEKLDLNRSHETWCVNILPILMALTPVSCSVSTRSAYGPAIVDSPGFASFDLPEGADIREWCRAAMLRNGWPLNDITCAELHKMLAALFHGVDLVKEYRYGNNLRGFDVEHVDLTRSFRFLKYEGRDAMRDVLVKAGWVAQSMMIGVDPACAPDETGIVIAETSTGVLTIGQTVDIALVNMFKTGDKAASTKEERPNCDWCHEPSGVHFHERVRTRSGQSLHPKCINFAKAHAERLASGGVDCPEERAATERFMRQKHVIEMVASDPLTSFDKLNGGQRFGVPCTPLDARIAAAALPKPDADPTSEWSAGATPSAEWP